MEFGASPPGACSASQASPVPKPEDANPAASRPVATPTPPPSISLNSSGSATARSAAGGEADLEENAPLLLLLVLCEELWRADSGTAPAVSPEAACGGEACESVEREEPRDSRGEEDPQRLMQSFHLSPASRFLRELLEKLGTPVLERAQAPVGAASRACPPLLSPPAGVILHTKYYDAPVRVACQCVAYAAQAPLSLPQAVERASPDLAAPSPSPPSAPSAAATATPATPPTPSAASPSSASLRCERAAAFSESPRVFPRLNLPAPPEALIVLCTPSGATRLAGGCERKALEEGRVSAAAPVVHSALSARARFDQGDEADDSLPLPACLRRPPYRLTRQPKRSEETPENAEEKEGEHPALAAGYTALRGDESDEEADDEGGAQDAEEDESGQWLSKVPVKLLVSLESSAERAQRTSRAARPSGGRGASYGATMTGEEEDPSEILFFEGNCLFEHLSLPLPGCAASAATGPSAAEAAPSSLASLSASGAPPKLLGTHDAAARLVDALHCHLWPGLKRRAPPKMEEQKPREASSGFSAFRMAPSRTASAAATGAACAAASSRAAFASPQSEAAASESDGGQTAGGAEEARRSDGENAESAGEAATPTAEGKQPKAKKCSNETESASLGSLEGLDRLIQQMRAARVESEYLSRAERRARAEAMAMKLASLLDFSDEED
ncbi:hypothetical protein BESB_070740 [Besnoitia besnoiti]|uniref:Alpha and gamma adaptin-binding protein p34 n=1 Tax=Besnoitia besnoiti TaxID=94643 RepID=A0A2A9MEV9_BESBE|nr:uncharacterized protein BESB_070740 [Besnoitia besnoiti]PFH33922.1 hypothetical protein BESB_070740 [Besnoitia besnoiti]